MVGRLAQVFSTRSCILASAFLFSIGGLVTSQAGDLKVFLIGRTISGAGGAGILAISLMLVLELSGKKKRGLFIGLANTGFTTGVALGAVIAGALVHVTGWVGLSPLRLITRSVLTVFSEISLFYPGALGVCSRYRRLF